MQRWPDMVDRLINIGRAGEAQMEVVLLSLRNVAGTFAVDHLSSLMHVVIIHQGS